MTSKDEALSRKIDRVKKSIEKFPAAASSLNSATGQLGQSVGQIDTVLKKFSIGIPTWVTFNGSADTLPGYYHEDLGYAKIMGKWGVAVRTVLGDVRSDEGERVEQWLFTDAPRFLAVRAIEKLPELLEAILKAATDMAITIAEKAKEVDVIAEGINSVVDPRGASARKLSVGDLMKRAGADVPGIEEVFRASQVVAEAMEAGKPRK